MWFWDGPTHRTIPERADKPKEPVSQTKTQLQRKTRRHNHDVSFRVTYKTEDETEQWSVVPSSVSDVIWVLLSVVMVTDYSIRLYLRIVILLVIPLSTECTCSLITSSLSVTLPEVLPFFSVSWWHNPVTIYSITLQAKKTQPWNKLWRNWIQNQIKTK